MVDVTIIGGGIVGLATGYQLLEYDSSLKLVILEKEPEIGQHQSGHNSGVIHSGIYYKPGSLKAQNCRRGIHLLLNFCDQHDIPYDICGKVIVATSQEEQMTLNILYERGQENGIKGLKKLGLSGKISIIGIAKKLEEIYYPNDPIPMYLDKRSETLKLIQHLRNEAHRFGIKHHRNKRLKGTIKTELNQIQGVGELTATKLLQKFSSVKKIKAIPLNKLEALIGKSKGAKVFDYFNG